MKSKIVSEERPRTVIVFDIDGALCFNVDEGNQNDDLQKQHADCIQIYSCGDIYVFKPYIAVLFSYLLSKKARIVFFSAGLEYRNKDLIEKLLTYLFGEKRLKVLLAEGQFQIFSRQHTVKHVCNENGDIESCKKSLVVTLKSKESLRDVILIDDSPSVICPRQSTFISLEMMRSIHDMRFESNNCDSHFYKNGIYYLLGLFITYFEDPIYRNDSLRHAMFTILHFDKVKSDYMTVRDATISLMGEMIRKGLRKVRERFPEAILYGAFTPLAYCVMFNEIQALKHTAEEKAAILNSLSSGERGENEPSMQVYLEYIKVSALL